MTLNRIIKKSENSNRLAYVLFGLVPIITHVLIEIVNPEGIPFFWIPGQWIGKPSMKIWLLISWLVIYTTMLVFYCLTTRIKIAASLTVITWVAFALANFYVYKFRGIPLLAPDFTTAMTGLDVSSAYTFTLEGRTLVMAIGAILLLAAIIFVPYKRSKYSFVKHLSFILLAVIIIGGGTYNITKTDYLYENLHVRVSTFRPQNSYRRYGQVVTLLKSIQFLIVQEPKGYSPEAAQQITDSVDRTFGKDKDDEITEGNAWAQRPNVICIMDETFTDFTVLGKFDTSEDIMPFYHSLTTNTIKGCTITPGFGAYTANSEFEFLTGMTVGFLPELTTPYQLYVDHTIPAMPSYFDSLGYQGILAFHPFKGEGYNREYAYPYLGFRDYISIEDMQPQPEDYIRDKISDKKDIQVVIEEYEKAKAQSDEPFFMFNVTMQNHSPWDADFDNLPLTIQCNEEYAKEKTTRFVNLIHESDAALEQLVTYFQNVDEPTVIVFFGDHEPNLSKDFYAQLLGKDVDSLEGLDVFERYKTPYMIWANYDIEEAQNADLSINYLGPTMKQVANLPLTRLDRYLLNIQKKVPILTLNGYVGDDGKYYDIHDKKSPYYSLLNEYNIMEYNWLFDEENMVKSFYEYN